MRVVGEAPEWSERAVGSADDVTEFMRCEARLLDAGECLLRDRVPEMCGKKGEEELCRGGETIVRVEERRRRDGGRGLRFAA